MKAKQSQLEKMTDEQIRRLDTYLDILSSASLLIDDELDGFWLTSFHVQFCELAKIRNFLMSVVEAEGLKRKIFDRTELVLVEEEGE